MSLTIFVLGSAKSFANPWIPKEGKWKYTMSYSTISSTNDVPLLLNIEKLKQQFRKSYENCLFIYSLALNDKKEANYLLSNPTSLSLKNYVTQNHPDLLAELENLMKIGADNHDIQILRDRIKNRLELLNYQIAQANMLEQYLIIAEHKSSINSSIEYGYNDSLSYGLEFNRLQKINRTKNSSNLMNFFIKKKLYEDYKGNLITLQPKYLQMHSKNAIDLSIKLGKSHTIKKKKFKTPRTLFGYVEFGRTEFLDKTPQLRYMYNVTFLSGVKINNIIIIGSESEQFNPSAFKAFRKLLRSEITIAYGIKSDNIKFFDNAYVNINYFKLDSLSTGRKVSSGYGIGLWLEF